MSLCVFEPEKSPAPPAFKLQVVFRSFLELVELSGGKGLVSALWATEFYALMLPLVAIFLPVVKALLAEEFLAVSAFFKRRVLLELLADVAFEVKMPTSDQVFLSYRLIEAEFFCQISFKGSAKLFLVD